MNFHRTAATIAIALSIPGAPSAALASVPVQPVASAPQPADRVATAQSLLDDLQHARYDAVFARFDDTMKAHVSAAQLKAVWESLPALVGVFREPGTPTSKEQDGTTAVSIPLVFANGRLIARIYTNTGGLVIGFLIQPDAAPPPAARADLPTRDVALGPGGRTLPATLQMPKPSVATQRYPAVVMVHGSGPQDRDETVGGTRVFRDLADGLADRGIASLRYEKRSKARPQDFGDAYTIDDETTDDAVAAVAFLRTQPDIDPARIFVVGHSLGAMMAPRIAQKINTRKPAQLAGLILLAAPARPLEDILLDQSIYLALDDGKIDDQERAHIDALKLAIAEVKKIDARTPATRKFLLDLPASYWLSLQGYDAVAVARTLPQPLLVLQGDRDFQVTAPDWMRWQTAFGGDARATIKHYPALNHLFVAGSGSGKMAEYATPAHVDARVVADIADWIALH